MVAVSRELFNKAVEGRSCAFFIHPNDPRCSVSLVNVGWTVLKGSAKYFFLMYLAQHAIKYKTLSKDDIRPIVFSYVRSVTFGVWTVCSSFAIVCICWQLTGSLNHDIVAYGVGATGGCGIYIDDPRRRPIVAYTVSAIALEALLRRLYRKIKRRMTLETFVFMALNAVLMYKMRSSEQATCKRDMWFYRPPRIRRHKVFEETKDSETGETIMNACPHAEKSCTARECYDSVMRETSKYYLGAMLFSVTRLLFSKPRLARRPILFLKTLFRWKNMKLACSFGWYIGVYKAISCCLCRWTKRDRAEYALIAGFFSGISYRFNNNLTILASLILYVTRIFGREIQEKYQLPRFHFVELSMILGLMTLMNTKLFDPESCPGGFKFMFDTLTQLKLESVFTQFLKVVEDQRKAMAA